MTADARPSPASPDVEAIVAVFRDACAAVGRGDVEGLMAMFHDVPGVFLYVAADYEGGERVELTYRSTDVWRRIDGRWGVVHEHASVPVDPVTGRGDLTSAPGRPAAAGPASHTP